MIERNIFKITRYNNGTLICITYTLDRKKNVQNLQFWLNEEHMNDYLLLSDLWNIMRELGKADLVEREIYQVYKEYFDHKLKYEKIITSDTFNTIQLANMRKPERTMELVTRTYVETQMEKIIKGE